MPERAAALADWLRDRLAREFGAPIEAMRIDGLTRAGVGQSSETLLFDASWSSASGTATGQYVLRIQPGPDGIFRHPDAVREFRVLEAVARHSRAPVPRVRWLEPDPTVLGAPFFVMDRAHGIVPAGKPSIHTVGWLPTLRPDQRRRLAESAVDAVVAIHAVDWQMSHAFLPADAGPTPGLGAHLAAIADWYGWATAGRRFPITDAALAYLIGSQHAIAEGEPVLLWGDARLGNMMFDEISLAVSAVLDWECATIGPAGVDVAHWLVFDEFATSAAGVDRLAGYPERTEMINRYEAVSGRTVDDLAYFEILQCLFLATTLIRQADAAVRAGRLRPETRMGQDNTVTQMLARRLGLPVPELAADYVAHRRTRPGDVAAGNL
jgi:aminoglycoside phosphotransferase (APT) family kinase protein